MDTDKTCVVAWLNEDNKNNFDVDKRNILMTVLNRFFSPTKRKTILTPPPHGYEKEGCWSETYVHLSHHH